MFLWIRPCRSWFDPSISFSWLSPLSQLCSHLISHCDGSDSTSNSGHVMDNSGLYRHAYHQALYYGPIVIQCWANVADGGPTLDQYGARVLCSHDISNKCWLRGRPNIKPPLFLCVLLAEHTPKINMKNPDLTIIWYPFIMCKITIHCNLGISIHCNVGVSIKCEERIFIHCNVGIVIHFNVGISIYCDVGISIHCNVGISIHCNLGISIHCNVGISIHCDVGISIHCNVGISIHCDVGMSIHCNVIISSRWCGNFHSLWCGNFHSLWCGIFH